MLTNKHHPPELAVLGDEFVASAQIDVLKQPQIAAENSTLLTRLFSNYSAHDHHSVDWLALTSGEASKQALAYSYAGHQFGKFTPFLGDGRSASIGRVVTREGELEISLKGIGLTPFGFKSDGFASVDECMHEFKICQQLESLNIPTVHALAVLRGEQQVYREGFKHRAMLVRGASSFIRFGTFEMCYFKKDVSAFKALCELVINNHFVHLSEQQNLETRYFLLLREIVQNTARLIAKWQTHGFEHGMMNTDNMSILGLTLDVGQSRFIDLSKPVSEKNNQRRYAFNNQPVVGLWNCNVLGRAFSLVLPKHKIVEALSRYETAFTSLVHE